MPKVLSRTALTVFAVCLAALVAPTTATQELIRSGARTVAVYATVTDAQGRLIPDLGQDTFEIYDEGQLQTLTVFSNDIQPITVVMMLDRSGSMRENFKLLEEAAEAFIRRLRPPDRARIGSFGWRVDLNPDGFTSDQKELVRIVRIDLQNDGTGPTPLWNAVNTAIGGLLEQHGRRVVLVFTDGDDNPANGRTDNATLAEVMERAQRENVMVYAVGLASTLPPRTGASTRTERPDPALPRLAAETGGGYFELTRAEDLASTFARVADELHRQYALGFEPATLDDTVHKLELRVKQAGAKVRARKTYLAAK